MVNFNDYRKPNGDVDWAAVRKAERAAGEICERCGKGILFPKGQGRDICVGCRDMDTAAGEVRHERMVRCPACWCTFDVNGHELFELCDEGDHDVCCPECDHDFKVTTHVTFTFTSPARMPHDQGSDSEP